MDTSILFAYDPMRMHKVYLDCISTLDTIELMLWDLEYKQKIGNEGAIDTLRAILIGIKNFFLNIIDLIKEFFKRLNNNNTNIAKVANQHLSRISSYKYDPELILRITPERELAERINILNDVAFNLATSIDDERDFERLVDKCRKLTNLGYRFVNDRLQGSSNLQTEQRTLKEGGWDIKNLSDKLSTMIQISTMMNKLESVKLRIERGSVQATREIEVLIAGDDVAEAARRREALNSMAIRTNMLLSIIHILQNEINVTFQQLNYIANALSSAI